MRHRTISLLVKLQSFVRMKQARIRYLERIRRIKNEAAVTVQKYMKGKLVNMRVVSWRKEVMDELDQKMDEFLYPYRLDLNIKLAY